MYKAVTRGIRVTVTPRFVEEESSPDEGRYFFAYTVEIANLSTDRVQLRARYWSIVDGQGQLQEVRGAGVVGKQPILGPGEIVHLHERLPVDDAGRHHGGHLRHGRRERRDVRGQHPRLLARQPACQARDALGCCMPARVHASRRSRCWRGSSPSTPRARNPTSPLIDFVEDYLRGLGRPPCPRAERRRHKAAIFATVGPTDRGGVVLSGHTDVVPVTGQAWTSDPFTLRVENGRAYGRGAVDMKGFDALALALAPDFLAADLEDADPHPAVL